MTTYKHIIKELRIISNKTHKLHQKTDLKRQKALLEYEKYQLLKQNKPTDEITSKLQNLSHNSKPDDKFEKVFKTLYTEYKNTSDKGLHHIKQENFKNVYKFLNSQRVYTELIERYNPGINFDQTENVEQSANRVGLTVPK